VRSPARLRVAAAACPLLVAACLLLISGCSGGSAAPTRGKPDLAGFLRLPVATPTACNAKQAGATVGRRSPWVGTVDVSVFLKTTAAPDVVRGVGDQLRALPPVATVFFESAAQAYAEFQRLYTCSADIPAKAVPASYRLVLHPLTRTERDDLVTQIRKLNGVESVSCDPSSPCLPS